MAATNQPLQVGQYVQYSAASDSPRSNKPSGEEETIGIVRQVIRQGDQSYYQVVWNPGDRRPKVGMYHQDQLVPVTQQQANDILNQLAAGTYRPQDQTPGTSYQQPALPEAALPPGLQGSGYTFTGTNS